MLKIKLIRFGQKDQPHYRVVVQEARTKRDGKYTAKLGHYAPAQEPKILEINLKEYKKWISKGAQPTKTVASLVKRLQSGKPFPPKKKKLSKKKLAAQTKARETQLAEKKEQPKKEMEPQKKAPTPKKEAVKKKEISLDEKPA